MNESQIYHEQTFTIPARVKTEWTVFGITRPRLLTMSPFGLLALSVYFLGDTLRLTAK